MGDAKKLKVEQDRKQFSLQNMYFNRYLIIRYLTALFFFHKSLLVDMSFIGK